MGSVAHTQKWQPPDRDDERNDLARIAAALEKIAGVLDEFARAYLNARFSGKGSTDRWAARR